MADETTGASDTNPAPTAEDQPTGDASLLGETNEPAPQSANGSLLGDADNGDAEQTETDTTDEAPAGAPEEYADFTLPDGVELPDEQRADFLEVARKANLSQDAAQALVTHYAEQMQAQSAALEKQQQEWRDEVMADPKAKEKLADARRFVEKFGDDDAKGLLYGSWVGSHPAVVNLLAQAGSFIKEDGFSGGPGAPTEQTPTRVADKLFADMLK